MNMDKKLLEQIVLNVPNYIFWKDAHLVYRGCNINFARIAGFDSPEGVIGKTDQQMPWGKYNAKQYQDEDKEIITSGKTMSNVEVLMTTVENEKILAVSKVPLYDENKQPIGILGIYIDITDRKKLEEAIIAKEAAAAASNDFVLELVKQVPAYVFWKDRNSVYLGCNNTFAYSLGLSSPAEIVGKTDYDLPTTKQESNSFRADDQQVIESKKPKLNIEEYQTLPDGRKVVLLTNKVPLLDKKNNVVGILGIYIDITDRKKLEEVIIAKEAAEAASKAKTEFLENMRHDIRTPLTGIMGFANIIKEETNDPKIKEYIDNLVTSTSALLDFMNEILEIIKLTSGEMPLYKYKFDLKKRINDVMQLNQAKAQEKKLDFELFYDPILPKFMIGDSKRIHRIILELVTNALNFTTTGCVTVSVELAKKIDRELIVKIIVSDTGIGIPAEKQQEIFMRFKKLHSSFGGMYKGAGLGLAVVKQFIDDLNGEIYVESELNRGSTFTCIFALKKALLDETFGLESSLS